MVQQLLKDAPDPINITTKPCGDPANSRGLNADKAALVATVVVTIQKRTNRRALVLQEAAQKWHAVGLDFFNSSPRAAINSFENKA